MLILIALAVVALILGAVCWGVVEDWIERTHGRNWPTVSAVIDMVSVAFIAANTLTSKAGPYYRATLTYTYKNPEQQMGDYSRDFAGKDDAEDWANSYKGEIAPATQPYPGNRDHPLNRCACGAA